MTVNDRTRFEQLAQQNQRLASRAGNPDVRKVHEAWVMFYDRLAASAAG